MAEDNFITISIHTYGHAIALKRMLESHGIVVRLEKFIVSGSNFTAGVCVQINEHDLPLALKITESNELIDLPYIERKLAGEEKTLLIPVDFMPYSIEACKLGFELALRLDLRPIIINAFVNPFFVGTSPSDGAFYDSTDDFLSSEIVDLEIGKDLREDSKIKMIEFRREIEDLQKKGKLPSVKFSCQVTEGVPEDVIREICKTSPPSLIVMATRMKQKKDRELIGSVTAEVLDSCRVPLFSIPEDGTFSDLAAIKRLAFFCNLDQHDLISIDTLMRMFDYPEVSISLIPLYVKDKNLIQDRIDSLCDYCNKTYPTAHFTTHVFSHKSFLDDFRNFEQQASIDMMVVPNRKRNIFARLLNPGLAHRLLFERDLPMLALPV